MRDKRFWITTLAVLFLTWHPLAASADSWEWDSTSVTRQGDGYEFNWTVPRLTGVPQGVKPGPWQKQLDKHFKQMADDFAKEARQARAEAADAEYKPNPWSSDGQVQICWQDEKTLILASSGYDYRGGAHGIPVMEVFVLSTRSPDRLQDGPFLFARDPEALDKLVELSRRALASQFREPLDEWALEGSKADWSNYALTYPTTEEGQKVFRIVFPPYQVAPYAAGSPSLDLDFEALAAHAKNLGK